MSKVATRLKLCRSLWDPTDGIWPAGVPVAFKQIGTYLTLVIKSEPGVDIEIIIRVHVTVRAGQFYKVNG